MYDFVLEILIMGSLAAMLYVAARAVPRVGEQVTPSTPARYLDNLFKRIPWEKLDGVINALVGKLLRKMKVYILRLDNFVSRSLKRFTNGNGKTVPRGDLFENLAARQEDGGGENSDSKTG